MGGWLAVGLAAASCRDPADPPPTPPPAGLPGGSQAIHVRWADLASPVNRPLAVVVDEPGGALDRLISDADATTFLNDRFTPLFLVPEASPDLPPGTLQVLDGDGCWLLPPTRPSTVEAVIASLNAVMRGQQANVAPMPRPTPPARWTVAVPASHPLIRPCPAP